MPYTLRLLVRCSLYVGPAPGGIRAHQRPDNAPRVKDWLAAKRGLKPSTLHGHRTSLTPVMVHLGEIAVQDLTERHIDDPVTALRAGGEPSPKGKARKPWKPPPSTRTALNNSSNAGRV